jgi:hypothetical protein
VGTTAGQRKARREEGDARGAKTRRRGKREETAKAAAQRTGLNAL